MRLQPNNAPIGGKAHFVNDYTVYLPDRSFIDPSDFFVGHSQFGEQGVIAACLDSIGVRNQWCAEAGAYDGVELSNTYALRERGWKCLLVEQNASLADQCRESAKEAGHDVVVSCCPLTPANVDRVLTAAGVPLDVDVMSLDIDGGELSILAAMRHRPRVLVIEYSPYSGPDNPEGSGHFGQAGFNVVASAVEAAGYVIVAATFCNVIAVHA